MKAIQFSVRKAAQVLSLTFILIQLAGFSSFAQISFHDDEKANSRKIRREAKKYKADDVKESHLDMSRYSFKKGEAGPRPVTEEMGSSVIYYGPNPVKAEKKHNRKKR